MPERQYSKLVEHARATYPEEACGLLVGRLEQREAALPVPENDPVPDGVPPADVVPAYGAADAVVKVVERVVPVENVDHSPEHFTIDPYDQLRVLREARADGLVLLGNFHSHPETPARPSAEDKRLLNDSSATYVIVSLADAEPVVNAFCIRGDEAFRQPVSVSDSDRRPLQR